MKKITYVRLSNLFFVEKITEELKFVNRKSKYYYLYFVLQQIYHILHDEFKLFHYRLI